MVFFLLATIKKIGSLQTIGIASKIKVITIFIADTELVLRMEWRLKGILRELREFIKFKCFVIFIRFNYYLTAQFLI